MKRDLYSKILAWKESPRRKPLMLQGARHVGKTTILKHFAKTEFKNSLYINFEESPQASTFFEESLSPHDILKKIGDFFHTSIDPTQTLIIFDEIHECQLALNSLKYFQEMATEYHVVAVSSLLGATIGKIKGFPVGKVDFLTLFPLTFMEFLSAMGKENLRSVLNEIHHYQPISEPIHQELLNLLRDYYVVGGMPEAISVFAETGDFQAVRKVQQSILAAYEMDFSACVDPAICLKITATWHSIPKQLAKENRVFAYAGIHRTAKAREYERAIQWLDEARLISRSYSLAFPKLPVQSEPDFFKVFMMDVGLLGALSQLSPTAIVENDHISTGFRGALIENFVAQELTAYGYKLFYWIKRGEAEVDFVIPVDGEFYPLEVKAGVSTKQKSLAIYRQKFHPRMALRASLQNLRKEHDFINYPLYLLSKFPIINDSPHEI